MTGSRGTQDDSNGSSARSVSSATRRLTDPAFVGGYYGGPPYDDGLAAIAVPLMDRTRVHGSINIVWIKTAFTVEDFAARHLADLQAAAAEIVGNLQRPMRGRPVR